VYVFGGSDRNHTDLNSLYACTLESHPIVPTKKHPEEKEYVVKWQKVDTVNRGPPPRSGHTCDCIQNKYLVIIGGGLLGVIGFRLKKSQVSQGRGEARRDSAGGQEGRGRGRRGEVSEIRGTYHGSSYGYTWAQTTPYS
jgi:hypothetical protein